MNWINKKMSSIGSSKTLLKTKSHVKINTDIHKVCLLPPNHKLTFRSKTSRLPIRAKFKLWYHKIIQVSEKVPLTHIHFHSNTQIRKEKIRQLRSKYWYCIHPFSEFEKYWQFLMIIVWIGIFIYDIYIPTFIKRMVENGQLETYYHFRIILGFLNLTYFIHMVLRCFTGYIDDETNIERITLDPRKSLKKYMKSWFWIDCITLYVLPKVMIFDKKRIFKENHVVSIIRYIRFLRLITVYEYLSNLQRLTKISYSKFKTLWYIFIIGFFIHFNACFSYFITEEINSLYPEYRNDTWIYILEKRFQKNKKVLHPRDIYHYCILEMLRKINGKGPAHGIIPKTYVSLFVQTYQLLAGLVMEFFIFRTIYGLFSIYYEHSMENAQNTQMLESFLRTRDVPDKLKSKILRQHSERIGISFANFEYLNASLTSETSQFLMKNKFVEANYFRKISRDIFFEIVKFMRPEVFLPNQIVYKKGDQADKFYGITFGSVALYLENNFEVMHLVDNDYFGFGIISENRKERITIISIESTEAWFITKNDLLHLCKASEEFTELIAELRVNFNCDMKKHLDDRRYIIRTKDQPGTSRD